MENEFKKRQMKRRGKAPSPSPEFDNTDNMYAAIANNPEFATIVMGLLAQKGLDTGAETSAQFVELLRSNPDFIRNYLNAAPEPNDAQDQFSSATTEIQQSVIEQSSALEATHSDHLDLESQLAQHDFTPLEPQIQDDVMAEQQDMLHSPPRPAPIPRVGKKTEEAISSVSPPPPPIPQPNLPLMPSPVQAVTPAPVQPRPSQDRVRALGFPPIPGR